MGLLVSEVEVSPEQGVNGPAPSVAGHDAKDSPARQHSSVADVVGATIAAQGVKDAFGILGSGNLIVTNALCRHGARFHHARHEGSAVCMADGYARVTGAVGVCSVHQGPGLTNTMTGLAEAAKSRTPVLVLAGETPAAALTSNFRIDQHDLVESVGAIADRVHSAKTAADDAARAYQRAATERRPVVLMLPIDIQPQPAVQTEPSRPPMPALSTPEPAPRGHRPSHRTNHQSQTTRDHRRPGCGARRRRRGARAPRRDRSARSWRRPRRPTACSRGSRTRSASLAVSPARSPPRCCPRPTSCSCSARRPTTGRPSTAR